MRCLLVMLGAVACSEGRDADHDGYITVEDFGYDCDDTDDSVRPGVPEKCDDWIDNNCDGSASPCAVIGNVSLETADANLWGEAALDQAGNSTASVGDVDNDGYDDIIVGAPGNDAGGDGAGKAYLVRGPVTIDRPLSLAAASFAGSEPGEAVGHAVAGAGDLDGDGFDDLVVGAWGSDLGGTDAGTAWVVSGPVAGDLSLAEVADGSVSGAARYDVAGWSVASAGDIDGDLRDDLLVGAPYDDLGGDSAGAVYLFHGPVYGSLTTESADSCLLGEGAEHYAGISASRAGDVNGDGNDDVVVGAYWEDSVDKFGGAAYLVLGPFGGTRDLATADAICRTESGEDLVGWSVAGGGDLDGDGYDDLLIGAYGRGVSTDDGWQQRAGTVYILQGPISGQADLGAADGRIEGVEAGQQVGYSVAFAGRVDGDRMSDVLVGGNGDRGGRGAAWLLYGPVTGTRQVTDADATFTGRAGGDQAGWSVASAGDIAGIQHDALLIGAPLEDEAGESAGAVHIVMGHGL